MIDWTQYENFSESEFLCPCCGKQDMQPIVISQLQEFRDAVGVPVVVTSGWRCEAHNKAVGGAPDSAHVKGLAVDFARPAIKSSRLITCMRQHFNGRGYRLHGDNQYCHGDMVPRLADWTYP